MHYLSVPRYASLRIMGIIPLKGKKNTQILFHTVNHIQYYETKNYDFNAKI